MTNSFSEKNLSCRIALQQEFYKIIYKMNGNSKKITLKFEILNL